MSVLISLPLPTAPTPPAAIAELQRCQHPDCPYPATKRLRSIDLAPTRHHYETALTLCAFHTTLRLQRMVLLRHRLIEIRDYAGASASSTGSQCHDDVTR